MFSSCRAADGGGPDHLQAGLGRTREDGPVGIVVARCAAPDGPTRSWWPRAGWPGVLNLIFKTRRATVCVERGRQDKRFCFIPTEEVHNCPPKCYWGVIGHVGCNDTVQSRVGASAWDYYGEDVLHRARRNADYPGGNGQCIKSLRQALLYGVLKSLLG